MRTEIERTFVVVVSLAAIAAFIFRIFFSWGISLFTVGVVCLLVATIGALWIGYLLWRS